LTWRRALGFFLLSGLVLLASCATAGKTFPMPPPEARPHLHARFVVISDPHVYDASLGTSGPAFERATAGSRVMYGLSAELLHEAVTEAIALGPDFLLLPGDLTKDGELSSHELAAGELSRLAEAGIRVYVIPGNHDIDNPRACSYEGGTAKALPSFSAEEFTRLYAPFGYGDALARDPNSLSYVARLLPGLRLLALDPFKYPSVPDPRNPEPESAFGSETMAWIRASLEDADGDGDVVIAMMHQSLLEHFEGQAKYFPDSFPRERRELASLLASHNVRLVFTGHFHIQDVVQSRFPGGADLYDIATGSTACYPLPYRVVEIGGDPGLAAGGIVATVRTARIASIPSMPEGLEDYAKGFLEERVSTILDKKLDEYFVPKADAESIAKRYAEAYLALSYGDETPASGDDAFRTALRSLPGRLVAARYSDLLRSLSRDLPPADNDLTIALGQ
jgi:3',5'-cyclic AMP phosphodiesterase CpdA